jgi:hypothetical protein
MAERVLPRIDEAVLLRIQQTALRDDSRMKKKFQRAIQEYINPPADTGGPP